jgi:type I restriction enzyme S subunit
LGDYLQISSERNNKEIFDKHSVLSVSRLYGVLNQIDLLGRSFAGSNLLGYKVVHPNDVIYTKSPLKQNPYGIIEMTKVTGIVSPLYAVYRPLKNVDSYFIHTYFALDTRLNNYLIPLVTKGAKNTLNVSDSEVLEGHVIFPHLKEQTALSEFFQRLDSLISTAENKVEALQRLKQGYMQKMFV